MHEQYAASAMLPAYLQLLRSCQCRIQRRHQEIAILELSSPLTTLRLASHVAGACVLIWLTLSLALACFAASVPSALMPVTPICV